MLLFLLKAAVLPLNLCVWVLLLNSAERLRSYYCEKIYVSLLVIRPLSTFHNGGKELEILCNNKQKKKPLMAHCAYVMYKEHSRNAIN